MKESDDRDILLRIISRLTRLVVVLFIIIIALPILLLNQQALSDKLSNLFINEEIKPYQKPADNANLTAYWQAFNPERIQDSSYKAQVMYGKDLIAHTSKYFGPKGSIKAISNGLNCQNCHLDAGTKIFGNNYGSVASTYPKIRARSGSEVDIQMRINDCFERSLNGQALPADNKELLAMVAYMEYIGSNVRKGVNAEGAGLKDVIYLKRAADPNKGKLVYDAKCASCHMPDGQGSLALDETEYLYPPLWGNQSFNDGAGLSRISNMARYVKYNMPLGVTHESPQLSDTESWDVSAYILSQNRPHLDTPNDWPDIKKKPIDHPFGPYADHFSEEQHKYGPFQDILDARNK
jgi:thiosulfate dehydrogenase